MGFADVTIATAIRDYFRNGRGATAVAPQSTRARPEATVSTPLEWDELSEGVRADHFRIDNLWQRLEFLSKDPWPGFFTLRQKLPTIFGRQRSTVLTARGSFRYWRK